MRTSSLALLLFSLVSVSTAYALSPVACTMDAKLCPDGVTYVGRDGNRNCQWQLCPGEVDSCAPYVCKDGTRVNKCAEDGTVINYFAAPCLTHGGEVDSSQPFSDVPPTHANAEAITYLKAQGVVQGYEDGTFRADATINRVEFVKIVMLDAFDKSNFPLCTTHYPESRPYEKFTDVPVDAWYTSYLCLALMQGVLGGYPDGTFRPSRTINFVEAAKIISNALGTFDKTEMQTDVWYEAYVRDLDMLRAIPLSITHFDQPITRGEMAEMIWRLNTHVTTKPSQTYESLSR